VEDLAMTRWIWKRWALALVAATGMVAAAEARNIPWLRLNEQSLIQLGHGKFQQRIQATVTSRTERLRTRLWFDKTVTIRRSRLGPVISDIPQLASGRAADEAIALRSSEVSTAQAAVSLTGQALHARFTIPSRPTAARSPHLRGRPARRLRLARR